MSAPAQAVQPVQAWVTLLTDPGYLPGVRVLQRSLAAVGSTRDLVVMVTGGVDAATRRVLEDDGCLLRDVETSGPAASLGRAYADPRFAEVWTKLAVWRLTDLERAVFLDADMLVVRSMDDLFEVDLPHGWIAAGHACRCNPGGVATYPAGWAPQNCSYTRGAGRGERPAAADDYFNAGLLVLRPDEAVFDALMAEVAALEDLSRHPFAEQDLLNEHFHGRWQPLSYVYNAPRSLPFQHPAVWDASQVRNIHYIGAKPWRKEPDPADRDHALDELWRQTDLQGSADLADHGG